MNNIRFMAAKWTLAIAFLLTNLYFCGGENSKKDKTGESKMFNLFQKNNNASVTVTELKGKKAEGDVHLIDVRTAGEFASGHAPGAINIPLDIITDADIKQIVGDNKETPVYVICRSGARSGSAINRLSADYNLINVTGGTMAWKGQGYPLD